MLVVHNRDRLEILGKALIECTQTSLMLDEKIFCGILLCCLDASIIIKRNGIEFHDFSWIVKNYEISIWLCNSLSSSSSCFKGVEPKIEQALSLKTAKQSLKYSYPGLRLFKNSVL